jgi:hypothetical protein
VTPAELLAALRADGVRLYVVPTDKGRTLKTTPLTAEQMALVQQHAKALGALVLEEDTRRGMEARFQSFEERRAEAGAKKRLREAGAPPFLEHLAWHDEPRFTLQGRDGLWKLRDLTLAEVRRLLSKGKLTPTEAERWLEIQKL